MLYYLSLVERQCCDNAIKVGQPFSEEDGDNTLMAFLKRKSFLRIGLLTRSSFLQPDGVRISAIYDCFDAQSRVVQLVELGCESDRRRIGEVLS